MSIAALQAPYEQEQRAPSSPLFWSGNRAAQARLVLIVEAHRADRPVACCFCSRPLSQRAATLEHLTPLSRGGSWARDNLALSCRPCNQAKGSMTAEEFRMHRQRRELAETYACPSRMGALRGEHQRHEATDAQGARVRWT